MGHKIGEIFEFKKDWYQCVEGRCKDCHFSEKRFLCKQFITKGFCNSNIIFRKLEKVGEPYFNGQYGEVLQEYKYYIPPITPDLGIHIIKLGIVGIEIKQTKDDMEEKKFCEEISKANEVNMVFKIASKYINGGITYDEFEEYMRSWINNGKKESKSNLKPFDLQKAKEGKPVCTRDGHKARIVCFDKGGEQPIVALIEKNEEESIDTFFSNGHSVSKTNEVAGDLMMLPEKKEGWVNVYHDIDASSYRSCGFIYTTKEQAVKEARSTHITTTKINWEE